MEKASFSPFPNSPSPSVSSPQFHHHIRVIRVRINLTESLATTVTVAVREHVISGGIVIFGHAERCRSTIETIADDPFDRLDLGEPTDPHIAFPQGYVGRDPLEAHGNLTEAIGQ